MSRENLSSAVAAEIIVCTKCSLSRTRSNAVPGVGSPEAKIMFVGEAPGQSEDVTGEPFVGAAGKFLDGLLSEIGLSRKDVFITNVVKCRPPRNRPPDPGEIAVCTTYLDRQVEIIKPCFIVTLGNHSTAYVFSKTGLVFGGITQVHGRFHRITLHGMQVTVFPTFHPASALYNPKYREMLHADFRLLKNKMCKQPLL